MLDPADPPSPDLALLHSFPHPACLHDDAFDVFDANLPFQQAFPGAGPGANLLTAMMMDPVARLRLDDWESEALRLISAFRTAENATTPERYAEIVGLCQRVPDWERLWHTEAEPADYSERVLTFREPESPDEHSAYYVRLFTFESPQRPWRLLTLIPAR
ncbi:hypothetical protein [Nocardia huaxiensis]|uniref:MmyB-like transcription regulator ligand binding domain-containing protein n=1 Tax=Nocardia huaxiensis TaxID=2755382 RepID=A0A7D6VDL0_9NOCA|nr:hypothetical protein [Nocardia huaxiensis]QLY32751.1 hypothetical protein H0264_11295 [Nocardia huaxiensis]UFS93512.1 hypothetical protein LPY97_22080 [Nocardia huaxiensis]